MSDGRDEAPGVPLRTRKRLDAMRRIQRVALEHFDAHGFDHVTIEQIAAASDVSPRSVYRYFGTKEQLVIWEPHEELAATVVRSPDAGPPTLATVGELVRASLVAGIKDDVALAERRMRLIFTHPSVEAAFALQVYTLAPMIAARLAPLLGRPADDPDVQVHAHAFVGGMLGSLRSWYAGGFADPPELVVERSLRVLARGLDPATG